MPSKVFKWLAIFMPFSYIHNLVEAIDNNWAMVLQQFGGSNAFAYYVGSIFESAGKNRRINTLVIYE